MRCTEMVAVQINGDVATFARFAVRIAGIGVAIALVGARSRAGFDVGEIDIGNILDNDVVVVGGRIRA
jgi:hypothetical protein